MINIRQGVFESNSSSCHSICISKTPVKNCDNRTINFRLSDFGWSEETCYNTEDYLYTAIVCSNLTPIEVEMYLDKLKKILDKHNIHYSFEPYKVVHSEYSMSVVPKRLYLVHKYRRENMLIRYELHQYISTLMFPNVVGYLRASRCRRDGGGRRG